MTQVKLEQGWKNVLEQEFDKPYFLDLKVFLLKEKESGHTVFPPGSQIFAALDNTPFDQIRVVILGQDPYHGIGQAHGLCFSVNEGIRFPPSLQNIFKELETDCGCSIPTSGNLLSWARQGVLMLNATLTVRKDEPGSHQQKGWEIFTDKIIQEISNRKDHVVFILWGKFAQSKASYIDPRKHLVLKAAHPSPFSAYQGFFGCRHFSQTNIYLSQHQMPPIHWQL
ncbi:MAG: uracil-DNA glycosylase [Bacteroidia bacterium]|jgi:uracil-DNA glycosylase